MSLWRLSLTAQRTIAAFSSAGGTRLAAAIAYYALLSLIPLLLVLIATLGLFVDADAIRDNIINELTESLSLNDAGRTRLEELLSGTGRGSGTVGLIGVVGLTWTASGLMGAIRAGINAASGTTRQRSFLFGKLYDLALVFSAGALLSTSLALTVTMRVGGEDFIDSHDVVFFGAIVGIVVPLTLTFPTLAVALRWLPAEPIPWSGVIRGALVGGVGVWIVAAGFALYVDNFGRYDVVYGSLGALIAFLVFVYLAAIVLLLAAALAGVWPALAARTRPPDNPYPPPPASQIKALRIRLTHRNVR